MVTKNVYKQISIHGSCPHCDLVIFIPIFPSPIVINLQNDHYWQDELSPGHSLISVICCAALNSKGLFSSEIVYRLWPFLFRGFVSKVWFLLSSRELSLWFRRSYQATYPTQEKDISIAFHNDLNSEGN